MLDLLTCRNPWILWYPPYPGHQPSPRSAHATKEEAWEAGQAELADRPDLVGQDVTIVSLEQSRRATDSYRFSVSNSVGGSERAFRLGRDLRMPASALAHCRAVRGCGEPIFGGPAADLASREWVRTREISNG